MDTDRGAEAAARFGRAVSLMKRGRLSEALAAYDEVLELAPQNIPSLNNRGIVLDSLGRHAEALASYQAALSVDPDDAPTLNNQGEALQKLMRADDALASYDAAIARAPDFAEVHGNRGHLLIQMGRTEEAIEALERAIGLDPSNPRFYQHLAPLRRFSPGDPVLEKMQHLARTGAALPVDGQIELGFALAKALADIGDSARAFAQLSRANRLKRSTLPYDETATLDAMARMGDLFGQAFQARMAGAGRAGSDPILIVGMPRSGSTLIEQMLASLPGVYAAGENTHLDDAVAETVAAHRAGAPAEGAARLPTGAMQDLASAYLRRLAAGAPVGARLVDKTLSNFRWLGLLHAAMPDARVVHVRRDPVDTCTSCYRLLFGVGQAFAYDLEELGRYYRALDRLMQRWRALLPANVLLELQYEDLIADPQAQARRLLDHCGLDWDPRCLEFHRTERLVRTSSASQVRRPLYTSAVGAARVYQDHLGPLLAALEIDRPETQPDDMVGDRSEIGADQGDMRMRDLERKAAAGDVAAQRAFAEQLDAAGRHTEAIDWLARAGQTGDAEALTRLGARLMTGQNAPFLPIEGARLLGDAASAGGVEAMERLAVLIGGGFYARQDWGAALDLLQQAAEGGSVPAQSQLQLLAGAAGGHDWRAHRQAIDVAGWSRTPAPHILSQSPRILSVTGLIPPQVCDWIIGQASGKLVRAELYDPRTGKPVLGMDTRLNRIANFNLAETHLVNLFVQARMAAVVGAPMQMLEAFAVLNYAPNEEYGEHVDYLDPAIPAYAAELARQGQRVATCLIYLNDDYEGGETEFPQLRIRFRGRRGDALIFFSADASGRPDPRTVHAGRTPSSGQKWLLSQFFRNRQVVGQGPRRA